MASFPNGQSSQQQLVQQQQQSGTNTPAQQGMEQQQQDLRSLALQQQLAALMQQSQHRQPAQQPTPASSIPPSAFQSPLQQQQQSTSAQQQGQSPVQQQSLAATLGFYQQLLALQQQQQQQPPTGGSSTPTVAALPQQFSNALHLQNPPSVLPQQLAAAAPAAGAQNTGGLAALLSGLVAANPSLLVGQQQPQQQPQQQQPQQSPLLAALAAQLLLPQQQQQQQLPAQQQLTASLLQMLNPATATLYAYQNYLQQQPATGQAAQLQLLVQLLTSGGANQQQPQQQSALGALSGSQQQTLLTALAAQQAAQQSQQQQQQTPQQQQESDARMLLEQLLRQQQQNREQQQQQSLQQHLGRFGAGFDQSSVAQPSPSSSVLGIKFGGQEPMEITHQQQQTPQHHHQQLQGQPMEQDSGNREQLQQNSNNRPHTPPSERLLTSEAVQDRISRLISENEAIVEPNPVLLKRRPYQRQGTSNSMTSQTSETAGPSQRGSPGVRSPGIGSHQAPKLHPATTRSFSLHEAGFLRLGGGSLTSGQPISRFSGAHSAALTCNFCQLKFPNEAGLEAHEPRCSKKELLQKQQSQPQLKLQQHQQMQMLQQLEHQSTIAALVGGGKGVARDLMINGSSGGRASVPSLASAGNATRLAQQRHQQPQLGQSCSDSRLKKRGLEQESSGDSAENMIVDVVSGGPDMPSAVQQQQLESAATKMARIEIQQPQQQCLSSAMLQHALLSQQKSAGSASSDGQQQPQNAVEQNAISRGNSSQKQPVLKMRDAIIFAITYSTDLRSTVKMPYFLTLTPAELDPNGDAAAGAVGFRGRTRNITSETFVCLNKVRPTAVEHRDNCSAYSAGCPSSADISVEERALAQLFLNARHSRQRQDALCGEYTLAANLESVQLRTTHSSFWTQQQQKARQMNGDAPIGGTSGAAALSALDAVKLDPDRLIARPALQLKQEESKMEVEDKENDAHEQSGVNQQISQKANEDAQNTAAVGGKGPEKRLGKSKFELNNLPLPKSGRNGEMEVYIRGRGRGRYVCERCGIRCKKPSMLKKHLRSHTNVRPFTCLTCNFSFKTKGNLTKHLVSKAHRRRMMDAGEGMDRTSEEKHRDEEEEEGEGRLVVAEEEDDDQEMGDMERRRLRLGTLERKFEDGEFDRDDEDDDWDDEADEEDDDDESPGTEVPPPPPGTLTYRRFGQEIILVERDTHTPPTLWTLMCPEGYDPHDGGNGWRKKREHDEKMNGEDEGPSLQLGWPQPDEERGCQSAPPAALCSPDHSRTRRRRKQQQEGANIVEQGGGKDELQQQQRMGTEQQPPPLANFIPPPRTQQNSEESSSHPALVSQQSALPQQPSLAAQLAAGLLQAAPFHHGMPIGVAYPGSNQAQQQLLFSSLDQQLSAFAPAGGLASAFASDTFATQSTLGAFLATEAQQLQCDMCDRKFRKESELSLHKQTHLIERNARQKTAFQCGDCPTVVRSKSMLARHSESVHGRTTVLEQGGVVSDSHRLGVPPVSASPPPTPSPASGALLPPSMLPPPPSAHNHFRNFICTDCNLGFRSHGVLAKHLRSKNHVKTLVSQGKLPEDANALLVKEHSKALGSIDAGDCEKALHSTKQLLAKMREQLGLDGVGTATEPAAVASCSSQQQGVAETPNGQLLNNTTMMAAAAGGKMRISTQRKTTTTVMDQLPHGLKRKNNDATMADEMALFSPRRESFSSPRATKLSREELLQQAESPLHSLAQVAVEAAAAAAASQQQHHSSLQHRGMSPLIHPSSMARTFAANVWVPPKLEQLVEAMGADRKSSTPDLHNGQGTDRLGSLLSNRSAEETSESTGTRSESSTPVQRSNVQLHHSQVGFSPMPASTRCQLCDFNFDSPAELAVHFHADHVVMRHGRDFRCSRRNCEKVFPSRESLRSHIHAHFFGGGATPAHGGGGPSSVDGRGGGGDDQFQAHQCAASCPASPSVVARQRQPPAPSAPPPTAQSPGVPEESHTAVPNTAQQEHNNSHAHSSSPDHQQKGDKHRWENGIEIVVSPAAVAAAAASMLHCQFCGAELSDVGALQAHWVKQHVAELARLHVCADCDGVFNNDEALRAHREKQHSNTLSRTGTLRGEGQRS